MITVKRYQLATICYFLLILVSFNSVADIDGYKDLKFGMTKAEAIQTKVIKNGAFLFGKKRNVNYKVDDDKKVSRIRIILGDYNQNEFYSTLSALRKKYHLLSQPSDNKISKYESIPNTKPFTSEAQLFALAFEFNNPSVDFEDLIAKDLSLRWEFANGQLTFVLTKFIDLHATANADELVYKDVIYLIYRDNELAKSYYGNIKAKSNNSELDNF